MNSLFTGLFFIFSPKKKIFIHNIINIQHQFTFKRDEKLKSRKMIQQLFKEGKSFSNFPLRVIFLEPEKQVACLQAAFSVSSKNFKKAVERNRIKRLMRESYRLQKKNLQDKLEENNKNLSIFFIYTGNEIPAYNNVSEKIAVILNSLEKMIAEND